MWDGHVKPSRETPEQTAVSNSECMSKGLTEAGSGGSDLLYSIGAQ